AVAGADVRTRDELAKLPGVAAVEPVGDSDGTAMMVFPRDGRSIVASVADLARAFGLEVTELRVERGRLDDVFRDITTAPPDLVPIAA
ncbi:MAG: hypothetical protein JO358_05960, partial [Alphaproteobacteria bacterium]|nr:hypothetical protein [Alphaproteobacteria bacterium]